MIVAASIHTSQSYQRQMKDVHLSNESLQTSQVTEKNVGRRKTNVTALIFKSRSTPPLHPISTPPCEATHLGQIVRTYRMKNDIGEQQFAATVSRSVSWLQKFEKSGACYERTENKIYLEYPGIRKIVLGQV